MQCSWSVSHSQIVHSAAQGRELALPEGACHRCCWFHSLWYPWTPSTEKENKNYFPKPYASLMTLQMKLFSVKRSGVGLFFIFPFAADNGKSWNWKMILKDIFKFLRKKDELDTSPNPTSSCLGFTALHRRVLSHSNIIHRVVPCKGSWRTLVLIQTIKCTGESLRSRGSGGM